MLVLSVSMLRYWNCLRKFQAMLTSKRDMSMPLFGIAWGGST